jgi:hypothetical protein
MAREKEKEEKERKKRKTKNKKVIVETNFKIFIPKTQTFLFRVSAFHKA